VPGSRPCGGLVLVADLRGGERLPLAGELLAQRGVGAAQVIQDAVLLAAGQAGPGRQGGRGPRPTTERPVALTG
jgi:hypothetical protein